MAAVVVKHEDDLEAKYGGSFKLIRHGLGVSSFGIQLLTLPANTDGYPEHDHVSDGQEEVYTALEGAAELTVAGQTIALEPGVWVSVPPEETRKVVTKDSPIKLLVIGGVPGKVYEASPFSVPDEG
jgi:quercetin dioxygenase-like cupin family protein